MTTLNEFLTSLGTVLASAGVLITAITGLIRLIHDIRSRNTPVEPPPGITPSGEPGVPGRVNGRKVSLWKTPPFVVGGTLLGLAAITGIIVVVLNNTPQTVIAGPCPNGYECLIEMSGSGQAFTWNVPPGIFSTDFTRDCAHSGSYGLHVAYTYAFMGNGNGGWGVHWANSPAKHLDASGHAALTFWVKGAKGGENVQVGLKDTNNVEHLLSLANFGAVTTSWSMISMQISQFQVGDSAVNIASLDNVSFGFNASDGNGDMCIDDITFQ